VTQHRVENDIYFFGTRGGKDFKCMYLTYFIFIVDDANSYT